MPNNQDSFEQCFSFHRTYVYINPLAIYGVFTFRVRDPTLLDVVELLISHSNPQVLTLVCLDVLYNGRDFPYPQLLLVSPYPYKPPPQRSLGDFLSLAQCPHFSS